jgi:hypothetical protein
MYDRIVFSRGTPSGSKTIWSLWSMATDGTDLRPLLEGLHYPESADLARMGVRSCLRIGGTLFLVDPDGRHLRLLGDSGRFNIGPQWSPRRSLGRLC